MPTSDAAAFISASVRPTDEWPGVSFGFARSAALRRMRANSDSLYTRRLSLMIGLARWDGADQESTKANNPD